MVLGITRSFLSFKQIGYYFNLSSLLLGGAQTSITCIHCLIGNIVISFVGIQNMIHIL